MSGCPFSTAESTANAVASSEKGTSSVARSTGRRPEERSKTSSRELPRRRVSMLFGVELPARRAVRRSPVPAPPERQSHVEPGDDHHRDEQDEARADDDDQRDHDRGCDRRRYERFELVAPHSAKQSFVLLRRDLLRVPRAPARLAAPAVAVCDLSRLAALALDRDRWLGQTEHDCTGRPLARLRGALKVSEAGVTFGPRPAAAGGLADEKEATWLRQSSRNASS